MQLTVQNPDPPRKIPRVISVRKSVRYVSGHGIYIHTYVYVHIYQLMDRYVHGEAPDGRGTADQQTLRAWRPHLRNLSRLGKYKAFRADHPPNHHHLTTRRHFNAIIHRRLSPPFPFV